MSATVFRKLPGLSIAPQLLPQDILDPGATSLSIPGCSDTATRSTASLFQPCKSIGSATARTAPPDPSDPRRGHTAQLQLHLHIRPGLPALAGLDQQCLYTDAFALGGDEAEVFVAARDAGDAGRRYAARCGTSDAEVVHDGVAVVLCGCGTEADMPCVC